MYFLYFVVFVIGVGHNLCVFVTRVVFVFVYLLYYVIFVIGVVHNLCVFVTRVVFVFVHLLYCVVFVIGVGHNLCVFVTRGKTIHRRTILQHSFPFGIQNSFFYLVYIETAAMGKRSPVNNY